MVKKTSLIFSLFILLSIVLSACGPGSSGISGTPGVNGNLPGEAMTSVATVVSGANNKTQTAAAKTPMIAGGSNTTPTGKAPAGGSAGTPAVTPAAPSALATKSGPSSYTLEWLPLWTEFFKNMPADDYIISLDALESKITSGNTPFLLDVRDSSEITKFGYIKGAVNIPWRNVLTSLNMLPAQSKEIIVYSGNEYRGTVIMAALRMLGYTNVYVLDGGISAWQKAQKPSETLVPPTKPTAGTAPNVDQAKLTDLQYFLTSNSYGITPKDLSGQLTGTTKPFILDVREQGEISKGSLEGSRNIPLKTLISSLNRLPTDKTSSIIIYDTTGTRGTIATMALQMIGYKNARSIYGGLNAWIDAGLPYIK